MYFNDINFILNAKKVVQNNIVNTKQIYLEEVLIIKIVFI